MEPIRLCDIIFDYCTKNEKYLVYYKLNYKSLEEKQEILDFYSDKIPIEYIASMKEFDEGFVVYDSSICFVDVENYFPMKKFIAAKYGENSPLYVHIQIYGKSGVIEWENTF